MALVDQLARATEIALDADAIIYFVEEHEQFLPIIEPVFSAINARTVRAHVSVVTLIEVLTGPLRDGHPQLANVYREIFRTSESLLFTHLPSKLLNGQPRFEPETAYERLMR